MRARCRLERGRAAEWVSQVAGCSRWRSGIVGEIDGVVSFEGERREKEGNGMMLCLGMPNDIAYHVRRINHRDREEHVSRQGQIFQLMLYRLGGEGDHCTEVWCVRRGTHHMLPLWAFCLGG